jgi:hypothetical protein
VNSGGILLHHVRLVGGLDPLLEARLLAALPDSQVARIGRRRDAMDRSATLLGIALLLECAAVAGIGRPLLPRLVFPAGGKPLWRAGPDFSIAHAAGRAACALAPEGIRVGLDIEARGAAAGSGLRLVSSQTERDLYHDSGLTNDELWTAKEAVLKAAGAGVADAEQVILELGGAVFRGVRYALSRPFIAPEISCTLAVTPAAAVTVREIDIASLRGTAEWARCDTEQGERESPGPVT